MSDLRERVASLIADSLPCNCYLRYDDGVAIADVLIRELSSWDMLLHILDTVYPADIFGGPGPDNPARDPGPRIISLLRTINEIREAE
jgi:hypothetical protein